MSYSNYSKVFKQLDVKPYVKEKYEKHNAPKDRKTGINTKRCQRCGRTRAHIDKYGLNLCRQCFRQVATKIGFKKYS
jgi:small subunit ribosomal protein S14